MEVGSRKRWTKGPQTDSDIGFPDLNSKERYRVPGKLPFGAKSDTDSSPSPERLPNMQSPSRRRLESTDQEKPHDPTRRSNIAGSNSQVPGSDSQGLSPKRGYTRTMLRDKRGHEMSKSNPALNKNNLRGPQEKVEQQDPQEQQPKKLTSGKLDDTLRRLDWQQKEYVKRRENRYAIIEFYTGKLCLAPDFRADKDGFNFSHCLRFEAMILCQAQEWRA